MYSPITVRSAWSRLAGSGQVVPSATIVLFDDALVLPLWVSRLSEAPDADDVATASFHSSH
eukprot:186776-Prymnesium_polylepis.1